MRERLERKGTPIGGVSFQKESHLQPEVVFMRGDSFREATRGFFSSSCMAMDGLGQKENLRLQRMER